MLHIYVTHLHNYVVRLNTQFQEGEQKPNQRQF